MIQKEWSILWDLLEGSLDQILRNKLDFFHSLLLEHALKEKKEIGMRSYVCPYAVHSIYFE
jgi:hypothetical protein